MVEMQRRFKIFSCGDRIELRLAVVEAVRIGVVADGEMVLLPEQRTHLPRAVGSKRRSGLLLLSSAATARPPKQHST
jgi:hypothetical protein